MLKPEEYKYIIKSEIDDCNDLRTLYFIMKIVFGLTREEGENNDKE